MSFLKNNFKKINKDSERKLELALKSGRLEACLGGCGFYHLERGPSFCSVEFNIAAIWATINAYCQNHKKWKENRDTNAVFYRKKANLKVGN